MLSLLEVNGDLVMAVQINQTSKTPFVHLCSDNARFIMEGVILPEDAVDFFTPIASYISSYLRDPKPESEILCKLEYFNTSSSRMLFTLFKSFNDASHTTKTRVLWFYDEEDDALEEVADEFQEILPNIIFDKKPFNFDDLPKLRDLVAVEG